MWVRPKGYRSQEQIQARLEKRQAREALSPEQRKAQRAEYMRQYRAAHAKPKPAPKPKPKPKRDPVQAKRAYDREYARQAYRRKRAEYLAQVAEVKAQIAQLEKTWKARQAELHVERALQARLRKRIEAQTEREVARKLERLEKALAKVNAKLAKYSREEIFQAMLRRDRRLSREAAQPRAPKLHPLDLLKQCERDLAHERNQYEARSAPTKPTRDMYDSQTAFEQALQTYHQRLRKHRAPLKRAQSRLKYAQRVYADWVEQEEYIRQCVIAGIEPVLVRRLARNLEANNDPGVHLHGKPPALLPTPGDPQT